METRTQRIVVETARHRIVGDITLPREGYRSRISDFLNQGDLPFIAIADATVEGLEAAGSGGPAELGFVAIGRAHIELAYPLSE